MHPSSLSPAHRILQLTPDGGRFGLSFCYAQMVLPIDNDSSARGRRSLSSSSSAPSRRWHLLWFSRPRVLTSFGRLKPVYTFFAQSFAMAPGLPGSYPSRRLLQANVARMLDRYHHLLWNLFRPARHIGRTARLHRRILRHRAFVHRSPFADCFSCAYPEWPVAACPKS